MARRKEYKLLDTVALSGVQSNTVYPIAAVVELDYLDQYPMGFISIGALGGSASPTLTVKIQHSADNLVWFDLYAFTAITSSNANQLMSPPATPPALLRYARALVTITGTSPTFAATQVWLIVG